MKPTLERLPGDLLTALHRCTVCRQNGGYSDATFVARNYSGQEADVFLCRGHAVMARGEDAVKRAEAAKRDD